MIKKIKVFEEEINLSFEENNLIDKVFKKIKKINLKKLYFYDDNKNIIHIKFPSILKTNIIYIDEIFISKVIQEYIYEVRKESDKDEFKDIYLEENINNELQSFFNDSKNKIKSIANIISKNLSLTNKKEKEKIFSFIKILYKNQNLTYTNINKEYKILTLTKLDEQKINQLIIDIKNGTKKTDKIGSKHKIITKYIVENPGYFYEHLIKNSIISNYPSFSKQTSVNSINMNAEFYIKYQDKYYIFDAKIKEINKDIDYNDIYKSFLYAILVGNEYSDKIIYNCLIYPTQSNSLSIEKKYVLNVFKKLHYLYQIKIPNKYLFKPSLCENILKDIENEIIKYAGVETNLSFNSSLITCTSLI